MCIHSSCCQDGVFLSFSVEKLSLESFSANWCLKVEVKGLPREPAVSELTLDVLQRKVS